MKLLDRHKRLNAWNLHKLDPSKYGMLWVVFKKES